MQDRAFLDAANQQKKLIESERKKIQSD
jgi:hypothetical protein